MTGWGWDWLFISHLYISQVQPTLDASKPEACKLEVTPAGLVPYPTLSSVRTGSKLGA